MQMRTPVLFAAACFLMMCLMASAGSAAGVSITAVVDKNEASLDDYIVLKVAVEGTREEPTMPDLSPLNSSHGARPAR